MSTQMLTPIPQRRQRGYGLVEVMISLVIIAILVAIAVALSINLRTSSSISANTNHITQIAANGKKSFGVTNQYSAIQNARAIRSVVPRELRTFNPSTQQYGDTAFNNFGGEVLLGGGELALQIGDLALEGRDRGDLLGDLEIETGIAEHGQVPQIIVGRLVGGHGEEEALTLADRLIVVEDGRIAALDAPRQVTAVFPSTR